MLTATKSGKINISDEKDTKSVAEKFSKFMEEFIELIKDIWGFLRVRKKYWLAPLIVTIVLMGTLIVFTQGSVIAPFIYSIF